MNNDKLIILFLLSLGGCMFVAFASFLIFIILSFIECGDKLKKVKYIVNIIMFGSSLLLCIGLAVCSLMIVLS